MHSTVLVRREALMENIDMGYSKNNLALLKGRVRAFMEDGVFDPNIFEDCKGFVNAIIFNGINGNMTTKIREYCSFALAMGLNYEVSAVAPMYVQLRVGDTQPSLHVDPVRCVSMINTPLEILFILSHEVSHLLHGHLQRYNKLYGDDVSALILNLCTDTEVNETLKEELRGIVPVPESCVTIEIASKIVGCSESMLTDRFKNNDKYLGSTYADIVLREFDKKCKKCLGYNISDMQYRLSLVPETCFNQEIFRVVDGEEPLVFKIPQGMEEEARRFCCELANYLARLITCFVTYSEDDPSGTDMSNMRGGRSGNSEGEGQGKSMRSSSGNGESGSMGSPSGKGKDASKAGSGKGGLGKEGSGKKGSGKEGTGKEGYDEEESDEEDSKKEGSKNKESDETKKKDPTCGGRLPDFKAAREGIIGDVSAFDIEDAVSELQRSAEVYMPTGFKRGRSSNGSGMAKEVKKIIYKTEVPWQSVLKNRVASKSTEKETSKKRINRRQPTRLELSGKMPKKCLDLFIAIDESGSIGNDEYSYFWSEILAIAKTFSCTLRIIEFTSTVESYTVLTPREVKHLNKKSMVFGSRFYGGTCFQPVFDLVDKETRNGDPFMLVVFTDGEGEEHIDFHNIKDRQWVLVGSRTGKAYERLSCKKNELEKNVYGVTRLVIKEEVK